MLRNRTMRSLLGTAIAAAMVAGTALTVPFASTADAQSWRYGAPSYGYDRGHRGYNRGYYRGQRYYPRDRYYSYRRNNDAAVAAGIIGFGAGVALGSAASQPGYYYAAPPPAPVYRTAPSTEYAPYYRSPGQGTNQVDPSAPVMNY